MGTREESNPESAAEPSVGTRSVVVLCACGIATLAAGYLAGVRTARVPIGHIPARLSRVVSPPPTSPDRPRDLPLTGTRSERLAGLDDIIDAHAGRDAEILPRLIERARLLLFEGHAPVLALRDLDRVGAFPQSDEMAEAMYLKVVALAESGALPRALDVAHDFFRLFRRSWRTAHVLDVAARILTLTGRESEAIAVIEDVLVHDPRRADRAHLDTGLRGRYPPRLDPAVLRLGRLYFRAGDRAAAEGAFALITRPVLGPDDFGECYQVSPNYDVAEANWCRIVLAAGDARGHDVKQRLRELAGNADAAVARLARFALGAEEAVSGERTAVYVETGRIGSFVAGAGPSGAMDPSVSHVVVTRALCAAYAAPDEVCALLDEVDSRMLSERDAGSWAVARARACEALGRVEDAVFALAVASGSRALLARADLALRHPEAVDRGDLAAAAERAGPFVRAILLRGALR